MSTSAHSDSISRPIRAIRFAADVDAAAEEQRRIGQNIHDGMGQELTGLRYMAQAHAESLAQHSSPKTKTAQCMTQWLETVQQLRAIIRDSISVEVDQQGLVAALRELAR